MPPQRIARRRSTPAALAGVPAVGGAGLYFVNPNSTHVPLCPLHALTGLWCPLCGGTRAGYALLHGQLATAAHDNLLLVAGLPLLALLWWRWQTGAPEHRSAPRWLTTALVLVGLGFGVVRNLPVGHWLAPPA